MEKYNLSEIPKSPRITRLVDHLYAKMPEIESYRAKLITESYKETEDQPIITRRAKAFSHILHNIPIIIRDEELIVGSNSIAPRGCQTFPEFSFQWLEDELAIIEIKAYVATKHEQQGDFREGNERACHASPREGDLMQHQTVDAESDGDGECSVDDDGG